MPNDRFERQRTTCTHGDRTPIGHINAVQGYLHLCARETNRRVTVKPERRSHYRTF